MTNKEKERIEKCVVQVECINRFDNKDKELGSGFFIDKNIVVTASHVISKYYDNPSKYDIYIIPIKAEIDKDIKAIKVINGEYNDYVSLLQLEEEVKNINPMKFTLGYEIKRGDEYYAFGHPSAKKTVGHTIEDKVSTTVNICQSIKIDWDLQIVNQKLSTFEGFSGSPIIINNMLVGIIQVESKTNGQAISLGMSSINIMKDYIPDKYCKDYSEIFDLTTTMGKEGYKVYTINDMNRRLKESTNPSISLDFFEIDDESFKKEFKNKLIENVYIVGKSREETLYCILNELNYNLNYNKILIVENEESWDHLKGLVDGYILIPNFYVGEIVAIKNNINIFIYGEDEHCTNQNKIYLKRRTRRTIINKLEEADISATDAYKYVEHTNGLYIPLKRKLFNGQYNILPKWHKKINDSFVAALLCGKWTECEGDKLVIQELSGKQYDDFMSDLLPFSKGEEPFIIEIQDYGKKKYQLANIETSWEYVGDEVKDCYWDRFKEIAYKVIVKIDPLFRKPFSEHFTASLYSEKPENSNELKSGLIRSMIFRGIYRDTKQQYEIDKLVKDILNTIDSKESWAYFSQFFTDLCEASPVSVLERVEYELKKPTGLIELFKDNSNDSFLGRNYYTNIIWAVEQLLVYEEYVSKAVKWLLNIDSLNITYKISNSPKSTLSDVFCAWINRSALKPNDKIMLAKFAIKKYENAWDLIFNELPGKHQIVTGSGSRPKYREYNEFDTLTNKDVSYIYYEYAKLCIDNINGNVDRWRKMIDDFSIFPDEILDQLLAILKIELDKFNDINKRVIKETLREIIYKHRYFSDSAWAMDEARIKKIEDVCVRINFEDEVYDYLYLFNDSYNIPILNPIPLSKEEKSGREETKKLKEREVATQIQRFKSNRLSLVHLIELIDESKLRISGIYIARYYTDGKFDRDIYKTLIGIRGIRILLCSYVDWLYRNGNKAVIDEARVISKNYEDNNELYVDILRLEYLNLSESPQIMSEDSNIKELYWKKPVNRNSFSNDEDTLKWILEELKKYNNIRSYIECLYEGREFLNSEDILEYMIGLNSFKAKLDVDAIIEYYVEEIMKTIMKNFNGKFDRYNKIMILELSLRGIIKWENMKCSQYIFKKDPSYLAYMVDKIYLHEGEEKTDNSDENIEGLFNLYYNALFCPCEYDGYIDEDELREWVESFKSMLEKQKQSKLLGRELGRLFAYSPVGVDGYYPHEAIRAIIEELEDKSLRNAYVIAENNKRGVYSVDEGKTTKEIAFRYKENADGIRILYPESAKIYDYLYKDFYYQSEAERRRAEDEY